MATELDPKKFANIVKQGFLRLRQYRKARALFIRAYVGQYYAQKYGLKGDEPINLIFHTIRALIPTLIMKNPKTEVSTEIIPQREYAYLLGLGNDQINKQINLKEILRYGTTDACFGFGIFKTAVAQSGTSINYGDMLIDKGQIFTDNVDLDDYVCDPTCRKLRKTAFEGDRNRIPRQLLLDDDDFNHDLVMQLPRSTHPDAKRRADAISQGNMAAREMDDMQDMVDVVELFVPRANALITIADPEKTILDGFLAARDYFGPEEGPYTKMALTQPVPGNPFPIAPAGIWYDLHHAAGDTMKKMVDQILRQRDILVVDPSGADEGEDIRTSADGDVIVGDPTLAKPFSIGGQNPQNEAAMASLQTWYNYMSGNPDQMAGIAAGAKTATGQSILQANQSVTSEDMRGMVYDTAAEIARKQCWHLHTDPFLDIMLSRRKPGGEQVQLQLTPEQRSGDWLDYTFSIVQRSMSRLDPNVKSQRIIQFATNLVPSLCTSAQICMSLGVPFNLQESITDLARELDILEEVQDWFVDPTFMQRIQLQMQLGPQDQGKASAGPASKAGIMQNNGSPMNRKILGPTGELHQGFQEPANEGQATFQGVRQ
jgi:hypothetical protein